MFELELVRRAIPFVADAEPVAGRYVVTLQGRDLLVDVSNLRRGLSGDDRDSGLVSEFVDGIVFAADPHEVVSDELYWCLDRNDYTIQPAYRSEVSAQVDRVLTRIVAGGRLSMWATVADVSVLSERGQDAMQVASANLDAAVLGAQLHTDQVDGAILAYFESSFEAKASFLLASSLQEIVAPVLGWPVLAIAPARDFQILWSADRQDLADRLGRVVAREHLGSPHPLSTELFRIGDGIEPLGAFDV
jgi:hypothetical protein